MLIGEPSTHTHKLHQVLPNHCSITNENLKSRTYVDLKLWVVKVEKLNVCEWRVFAEPVTYV